jgi:hypothetical protein
MSKNVSKYQYLETLIEIRIMMKLGGKQTLEIAVIVQFETIVIV